MSIPSINQNIINNILNSIGIANRISICSLEPSTYFNACFGDLWTISTSYSIGDMVRSPIDNNMVYECIEAGTSGTTEPPWSIIQDNTFYDNDILWKSHENYILASTSINPNDNIILNNTLTIPEKAGISVFRSGDVLCSVLLDDSAKSLLSVATSETTVVGDNEVLQGRIIVIPEQNIYVDISENV